MDPESVNYAHIGEKVMEMPQEVIPLVAIGGGMLIGIVAIICGTTITLFRIHRQSNLKQMMLEAGMPPHEIERVINCGQQESCKDPKQKSYDTKSVSSY